MKLGHKIRFCTPDRRILSLTVVERKFPVHRITEVGTPLESGGRFLYGSSPQLANDPILRGSYSLTGELHVPLIGDALEFANCRTDTVAVERFTRRHGPLFAKDDGTFEFTLRYWCAIQAQFRCAWDGLLGLDSRYPSELVQYLKENAPHLFAEPLKRMQASGHFELTPTGLDFVAESLFAALLLVLFSIHEQGNLRHCAKPDCTEPYFIAAHPRQRYCTEICAAWAQSEFKRTWWREKGKEWREDKPVRARKSQKRSSKERTSHGTQKAR